MIDHGRDRSTAAAVRRLRLFGITRTANFWNIMTEQVHIANTGVEFEFARSTPESLELSISRNPLSLQLQFLPLLYADPDEIVGVTALPDDDFLDSLKHSQCLPHRLPQLALLKDIAPFQGKKCASWGPSLKVKKWTEAREMSYELPNWEVAKWINSKSFSFSLFHLPESSLIENEESLREWMKKTESPKVLKTCYGLSGTGNWLTNDDAPSESLLLFCHKEWKQKRPLIAEPWLDRVCDFSSQWMIHQNQQIEWIGATRFETDSEGTYRGTLAGPEEILFSDIHSFLKEHRTIVFQTLTETAQLGFYGPVGVDALLYRETKTKTLSLYPLVEINGRETMSLVALRMQKRICPDRIFCLSFTSEKSSQCSLLPHSLLNGQEKIVNFRKKLRGNVLQKSTAIPFL